MSLEVGEREKCYRFAVDTMARSCRLPSAFNDLLPGHYRPQLIHLRRVTLAHKLPTHRPSRCCRHAG
jgi:hypothetical protein